MTRETPQDGAFARQVPLVRDCPIETLLEGTPCALFPAGSDALPGLLRTAGLEADGLPQAREGIHGVTHYRMVAALAVKLALSEGWNAAQEKALSDLWCLWVAGCLHDLERWDDALDWGHAKRGAQLAQRWLPQQGVEAERVRSVADLIRGHGERDERAHTALQNIFKDADGLDRFRLGSWQCDPKMLRTPSAKALWPEMRALYRGRL